MDLSNRITIDLDILRSKVRALHYFNPLLGHRGCRLAITYPEIYAMQVRAIAEAAAQLVSEGMNLSPEIMIPLVGMDKELEILRALSIKTIEQVQKEKGIKFDYTIGTMIELPRAAVTADAISKHADFFSFGTNDLTQTTLVLSRYDSGRFLERYVI